jgi:uncharacterized protein (TIGR02217 family)
MALPAFHDVSFPTDVAIRAKGGPERITDVIRLGSGRESRNSRFSASRRRFDAGYGVRSFQRLASVIAFFEARAGRLHGFRFRDRLDFSSAPPGAEPAATDQPLGTGDGTRTGFDLVKRYGDQAGEALRRITRPVPGSVLIAVAGAPKLFGVHCDLVAGGRIVFRAGHIPAAGQAVTAGFLFDVPVRFDTDRLDIDIAAFEAGEIPSIPLVEIAE